MNKTELFKQLVLENTARQEYIDRLPYDISAAFFDNQYVNSLSRTEELLIEKVFEDRAYAVYWFLYEWKPGMEVGMQNVKKKIDTVDQYIEWMTIMEGWQE
jgi:cobalamin-dependent methionine synthase I